MPLTDDEIREMAAHYSDKYQCFVNDKYDHDAEVDAATLVQICDRLLSAEAKVKALEEALRPFAEQADTFDSVPRNDGEREFVPDEFEPAIVGHTIGDLRRARAELQKQGK
jgi:hypothetical protein